jgi:hypothetical protein
MKRLLIATSLLLIPTLASAQNIGQCGWGSKLMAGQRGIAPQVLAATTNGTSGNQTFAITTGTSGCTQDGVVSSSWKTAKYIDSNLNKLARDVSAGQGETLTGLASLLNVEESLRPHFYKTTQENFATIFAADGATTDTVIASLKSVLSQDSALKQIAEQI